MKKLLLPILCCISLYSASQNKFNDANTFGIWMMEYYKNPEPDALFEAFHFATTSEKIEKSGSRPVIYMFIASAIRTDTLRQREFFNKLKATKDKDPVFGFGIVLWLIHTEQSQKMLDQFISLKRKYKSDFDNLKKQKYEDILIEPVTSAMHLDMLWASFFATGSAEPVRKIISKLSDIDSDPTRVTASARWSLTSNAIRHDIVYQTCEKVLDETSDEKIRKTLTEVITKATEERSFNKFHRIKSPRHLL